MPNLKNTNRTCNTSQNHISNSRQAFENVRKLLKPNGIALIVFLVHTPLYDIYEKLSKFDRYRRYMRDVRKFISPYHYERSRATELVRKYAEGAGLNVEHCESREKIFIYESDEHVKSEFLNNFN
jgi:juvenile hormone acid methyltransferase